MQSQNTVAHKLILNAVPITFPNVKIQVGRQPFKDSDHLRAMRRENIDTHIFKRRGDQIIDIPVVQDACPLGNCDDLELGDDFGISRALVLNAYLNYVLKLGRPVIKFDPVDFLAKDDLLKTSIPAGIDYPDWLRVHLRYQIDVRTQYVNGTKPFLALVLRVRTATVIDVTCDTLAESGIGVCGRYVQEVLADGDPRLRPRRRLLGKAIEVRDGVIHLADTRDERKSIEAERAYIEPRRENLRLCIRTVFGNRADSIQRQLESQIAKVNNGEGRLARIREVTGHLIRQEMELAPGIKLSLGPLQSSKAANRSFPAITKENSPVYVFGAGTKTSTWHDKGLNDYGPYDQSTFTPSSPQIAVICQSRYRGQTEQFIRKLLDGVHGVTDTQGRERFGNGLVGKYCLDKPSLTFFEADGDGPEAYKRAIAQAITAATDRRITWNLAIVQIEERFHQLYGDENPYLISKAAFLLHGVPSQEVEVETMQVSNSQIVYTLNNVALACYAKLGGTPWLLQADRGIAHELIFGLGSASIGDSRLDNRERIVGITTVFNGDGNYLLENCSNAATMDQHPQVLLSSLEKTIDSVRRLMNWQKQDTVRLIFHAFKPFRTEQIDSVKAVMTGLNDFNVQFAFLHVIENHPYLVFDENNPKGVPDYGSKGRKGILTPARGLGIKLSDFENLLVLTGAKEVKRPEDGIPAPILLRLDRNSTFKDMKYLTRQVFQFSCHSWRSFFPAPMPITILYSGLIASLLGDLSRLTKWDSQAILGPIGRTRWFL